MGGSGDQRSMEFVFFLLVVLYGFLCLPLLFIMGAAIDERAGSPLIAMGCLVLLLGGLGGLAVLESELGPFRDPSDLVASPGDRHRRVHRLRVVSQRRAGRGRTALIRSVQGPEPRSGAQRRGSTRVLDAGSFDDVSAESRSTLPPDRQSSCRASQLTKACHSAGPSNVHAGVSSSDSSLCVTTMR
jgi:hypothetical protein